MTDSPTDGHPPRGETGYSGRSMRRIGDDALLRGRGRFVDNLAAPGALWIVLVRSPFANARILRITAEAALATPGVVAVLTGEDIRSGLAAPLPMIWPVGEAPNLPDHWPLAVDRTLSIQEVAGAAYLAHRLPEGVEPGLEESTVLDPPDWTYPFGTHVAVVEVDRDTGAARILRYVAVDDCGRVINPMIVDGQIHGGVAQGIAQPLFEEISYTQDGQPETGSFMTYLVPGPPDLPPFELGRTMTPSPLNPLGAKGVGEAGTIAAPPAVMNAVHDALGPDVDVEIDMPATPEKLWRALRGADSAQHGAVTTGPLAGTRRE